MEKFTKLGLGKELTDVLKRSGFKDPTEIQEKAIPLALAGKDIIGGSATGSGKTLAFAAPIIENLKPSMNVQAIILTPTRELAEQVATSIRDFGKNKKLNVLAVYGGVKIDSQIRKLGTTDILVGTPGRILDHLDRRTLRLDNIKFLVLDEVDRMFDMGFSKDVEKIIKECPKERQTMMFSATVSQDIDYLAKKYTKDPVEIAVESHVDPTKLKQVYYDVPDNKKFSLVVHLLKQEESNFVLVFCSTRRNVDFVTDNLIRAGIKAKAIHGGLDQKKRLKVLTEFKKKGTGILVCTDVAARGLDIEGVSHVYNYDVPADAKDYIHRIGRTARAGKEGKAITILSSRDYEKFGTLTHSKELKIAPEKLPQVEMVRIRITQGGGSRSRGPSRGGFSRGGSRGPPRRDSRPRSSGGYNRSGSSSYSRDSKPRSSSSYSRDKPRSSGGYNRSGSSSYSRDKPRSSGGYNRSGPRKDSRPRSSSYSRDKPRSNYSRDKPRSSGGYNRDKPRSSYSRDGPKKYSNDRPRSSSYSRDSKPRTSSYNRSGSSSYSRDKPRSSGGYNRSGPRRDSRPRSSSYSRDKPRSSGGYNRDSKPRSSSRDRPRSKYSRDSPRNTSRSGPRRDNRDKSSSRSPKR